MFLPDVSAFFLGVGIVILAVVAVTDLLCMPASVELTDVFVSCFLTLKRKGLNKH